MFGGQAESILGQASNIGFPRKKTGWYTPNIYLLSRHVTPQTSEGLGGATLGANEDLYDGFLANYEQRYSEKPSRVLSAYAYDAIKMVALAMNRTQFTDPEKMRQALFEVSNGYKGVTGSKEFDQDGMQVSQIYWKLMFKEGKLVKYDPCPRPPWCRSIKY